MGVHRLVDFCCGCLGDSVADLMTFSTVGVNAKWLLIN